MHCSLQIHKLILGIISYLSIKPSWYLKHILIFQILLGYLVIRCVYCIIVVNFVLSHLWLFPLIDRDGFCCWSCVNQLCMTSIFDLCSLIDENTEEA